MLSGPEKQDNRNVLTRGISREGGFQWTSGSVSLWRYGQLTIIYCCLCDAIASLW